MGDRAWAGEFTAPWDARRGRGQQPALPANEPEGADNCRGTGIKGNINRRTDERIYHVPGSSSYKDTVIDELEGERWFCTEEDAVRAGWRAPRG